MTPTLEKLTTARVALLLKHPFFGNLATRMQIQCADDWCATAATDGKHFFYNTEFVNKLTTRKLEFLFAHEILHAILDHFGRTGNRDRQLSNISQDFAVNQILVDDRIGDRITEVDICYDPKYRGWAWEEIYDELYGKLDHITLDQLIEKLGTVLDEHLTETLLPGENHKENGRPVFSRDELAKIRDEVKQAMLQAASAAGAGRVPAAVMRIIKDLTEPKMDWKEVLQCNIQSIVRNDYSFASYNKKSQHSGAVLPGMTQDEAVEVAIALDMSGSISQEDVKVFLSEVKGIMDQYTEFAIDLWTFDTKVYNHVHITHDDSYLFDEYVPVGGGGTEFMPNWDFMKEKEILPKKFVMLTDGCPYGSWGDPDYCDTLFVVKGSNNQAPFGETVLYESLG